MGVCGNRSEVWEQKRQLANLTAAKVKVLRDPGRHADGSIPGLYFFVNNKGYRSWVQRIVDPTTGKRRDVGLGSYPEIALSKAREYAGDNRRRVAEGTSPLSIRERRKSSKPKRIRNQVKPTVPTFEEMARAFHDENRDSRWSNEKNRRNWLNRAEKYLFPAIGDMLVDQIAPAHLLNIIVPLRTSGKAETSKRLTIICRQTLGRAVAYGLVTVNVANGLGYGLPPVPPTVNHMRALPYSEVADALDTIDGSQAHLGTKLAIRFMVLTAARGGEVRGARWSEIDLDSAVWAIPAFRMKQRRDHVIPLSRQAVEVLNAAWELSWSSEYVFPSVMNDGRPLSENAFPKLFRELEIPAVPHGLRTSFRTWASEKSGASWAAVELSLSHNVGDSATAAYFRTELLSERRKLMQDWADLIAESSTAKV